MVPLLKKKSNRQKSVKPSLFFEKNNKIEKILARLAMKKRENSSQLMQKKHFTVFNTLP